MGLSGIRDGLGTRLATISGLVVYHEAPAKLRTPCAVVLPGGGGDYDYVGGGASCRHKIIVTVYIPLAQGHERAQAELDAFIAPTGSKSIKAAVEGDGTLGGNASDCRVTRYYDYGGHQYGDDKYLGCRFEVDVLEG